MVQGSSQRVAVRVRLFVFALVLPLAVALSLILFGAGGVRATQILTHGPLTLYGGPGDAFAALATLAGGAKVEIMWCNAEASWCLVQNGAVQGWAPRKSLLVPKPAPVTSSSVPSSATVVESSAAGVRGAANSLVGPQPPAGSLPKPLAGAAATNGASAGGASGVARTGLSIP